MLTDSLFFPRLFGYSLFGFSGGDMSLDIGQKYRCSPLAAGADAMDSVNQPVEDSRIEAVSQHCFTILGA